MSFSLLHSAPLYQNTKEDWFAGRGGSIKRGRMKKRGEGGEIKGKRGDKN